MIQRLTVAIESVTVMSTAGPDYIFIRIQGTPTMPNLSSQGPTLKFEVAAGDGVRYVKEELGLAVNGIATNDAWSML